MLGQPVLVSGVAASGVTMSAKRILVVDDEAGILDLLREALGAAGFEVDCAGTAEGALELVREHIFDAAILDFDLPDMNGVMLHRLIRQMDEELGDRSLFISGMSQSDKDLNYYEAFGRGFVPKPFQVSDVLQALSELWDGG
jgi:DNA-binding response OmpR family regulator